MMNVLTWVKNNKIMAGLGAVVLGCAVLALTTRNEETEEAAIEFVETEENTTEVESTKE